MKNEIWSHVFQREKSHEPPYSRGVKVTLTEENNGYFFWLETSFVEDDEIRLLWHDLRHDKNAVIRMAVLDAVGEEPLSQITEAIAEEIKPC